MSYANQTQPEPFERGCVGSTSSENNTGTKCCGNVLQVVIGPRARTLLAGGLQPSQHRGGSCQEKCHWLSRCCPPRLSRKTHSHPTRTSNHSSPPLPRSPLRRRRAFQHP